MKLSLVVLTSGKWEGKVIPVPGPQFLVGRDPQCHLRPASPIISKRHCAVLIRDGKAFVKDFGSTNGTFVNDEQVDGERELSHEDKVSVGPLTFSVRLELPTPVDKPTPVPPTKAVAKTLEEEAAEALLLATGDEGNVDAGRTVDSDGIPTGSTVLDVPVSLQPPAAEGDKEKAQAGKVSANADTSAAAKALLEKYIRRR